jgi:hypothetical protein
MKLTISRNASDQRAGEVGDVFCFEAQTITGDSVTVEVTREAWERIQADYQTDPIAKLEEMSADRRAHWANFSTKKVWRLYL